jgi:nitronate monooxygenase
MVGIGSAGCALVLDEQLGHLRELGRPFGIGLVAWVVASEPQLLTAAIAAKPALLSVSFGEDFSWVRRAHDAGIAAATQVGDLAAATRAVEAGCDVVTARGAEGTESPPSEPCRCWRPSSITCPSPCWPPAKFPADAPWPPF